MIITELRLGSVSSKVHVRDMAKAVVGMMILKFPEGKELIELD